MFNGQSLSELRFSKTSRDSIAILHYLGYDDHIAAPRTPGSSGAISAIQRGFGLSESSVTRGSSPNAVHTVADADVTSIQDRHRFDERWQNRLKNNTTHLLPTPNRATSQ
jgi:hypothetical protein